MKTINTIVLVFTTLLSMSQARHGGIHVSLEVDPLFERMTIRLRSDSEKITNCKAQIIDSKNNAVKAVDLPEATDQLENNIVILDLLPGNYTCIVYKGKEIIYKGEFLKDAIFSEPHHRPLIHEP